MTRILVVALVAVLAACGAVDDRPSCRVSTDCPVGQYCATAEGERGCWPDAVAPVVTEVTVTCGGSTCLRTDVLHVEATATDAHDILDVTVTLDLDPTRSVPLARSGGERWVADVPLRSYSFEAFERDVSVTATARDGARNGSAPLVATPVSVTRALAPVTVETGSGGALLTVPAVMDDGTVVVGGPAKLYVVRPSGTSFLSVGGGNVTAIAIGRRAIWAANQDRFLYGVKLDGTQVLDGVSVNTLGAATGAAVTTAPDEEWGIAASDGGYVAGKNTPVSTSDVAGPTDSYSTGPLIDRGNRVYAASTSAASETTLRCFPFNGTAFGLPCGTSPTIGTNVTAPLALDGADRVWSGSGDRKLSRSDRAEPIAVLAGAVVDSPVVLASGDVVVGDSTGLLHRFTADGAQVWGTEANLGAAVLAPLVLAGTDTELVVPTRGGKVFGLRGDGSTAWETTLATGITIRGSNIYTPPSEPAENPISIAYFTASDGKLYALLVDGKLDTSAPWPKAFHDPRNTNNAGTLP